MPEFDEDSESDEESDRVDPFVPREIAIEPDVEVEDFVEELATDEFGGPSDSEEDSAQVVLELPNISDMNRPDMTAQEDPNAE